LGGQKKKEKKKKKALLLIKLTGLQTLCLRSGEAKGGKQADAKGNQRRTIGATWEEKNGGKDKEKKTTNGKTS